MCTPESEVTGAGPSRDVTHLRPGYTQGAPSTSPGSGLAREILLNEAERKHTEIHKLQQEIAAFQSIHNLVAPINTLPLELLNMILFEAVSTSEDNAYLISLTHVCRHWRDVALHSAVLWTRITLTHPEGIRTFLDRSQALPLRVAVHSHKLPMVTTIRTLAPGVHRMRSLKVSIPRSHGLAVVLEWLHSATPLLEELFLEAQQTPPGAHRPHLDLYETEGPLREFDGAPLLRSLTLHSMRLPFLPKGPSALTTISLDWALPSTSILLSLLERSPSLEHLRIHGFFNEDLDMDPRKVTLAHLRTLDFRTDPSTGLAAFLPSLVLPAQTNVILSTTLDFGEDIAQVLPAYDAGASLAFASFEGLKRLQLVWTHHELWLQAFREDGDHTPALKLTVAAIDPQSGPRFFGDWPIDAAQLETLVLCGNFNRRRAYDLVVGGELWAGMLLALPALRTLRIMSVNHQTMDGFAQELVRERAEPVCPHLETLELYDMFPRPAFWDSLLQVLESRSPEAGGPMARLELFSVEKPARWKSLLDGFKKAGLDVIIDGSEDSPARS